MEDSLEALLLHIDNAIQYGEDLDVKVPGVSDVCNYLFIESDKTCVSHWVIFVTPTRVINSITECITFSKH